MMAWIESHVDLMQHPKFLDLLNYTGMNEDIILGKLHRFWYWAIKYAEDGDLRKFNDLQLARAIGLDGSAGKQFIEAMVKACWLDRQPYFRIHDWWDYAGRYLQGKYKRTPDKWERIRELYKPVGENNNRTTTEQQPNNNLLQNRTNQPTEVSSLEDTCPQKAVDICPHQEIIKIYYEVLPELPKVCVWTPLRQKYLKNRWNEKPERRCVDWWRRFFQKVKASDFLCGRVNGTQGRIFQADLEWLIKPANFIKVLEGRYDNRTEKPKSDKYSGLTTKLNTNT